MVMRSLSVSLTASYSLGSGRRARRVAFASPRAMDRDDCVSAVSCCAVSFCAKHVGFALSPDRTVVSAVAAMACLGASPSVGKMESALDLAETLLHVAPSGWRPPIAALGGRCAELAGERGVMERRCAMWSLREAVC